MARLPNIPLAAVASRIPTRISAPNTWAMGNFTRDHLRQRRQTLRGGSDYRLNVRANPPVRLYWSATVYDRATHAFIREIPKSAVSSLTPGLVKNADGLMDVYFGMKAPPGKEANWVPTK